VIGPLEIVLAPWRAVQVLARAADDLNAVAERARRDPDPLDEARARLEALGAQLDTLIGAVRTVDTSAVALGTGGEDLLVATRQLITGGQDLTAVANDLARSMRILRAALPRILEGLDTVEELETSVETVAETVEPLQDVAKGVGRVTDRLSRRG
jgi:methyl-accepting chemotaxis protein